MADTPRVAAIHDLSGFGRCSLTVVGPVLSAMGVQCCPIPTAYLSTHTGGFEGYVSLDLTDQMAGTIAHWRELGLSFDGVYTGFMASARQMELAGLAMDTLKRQGGVAVADPVMGDHGRRYATYTDEMCRAMGALCAHADVITPNLTEAAFLLGLDYGSLAGTEAEGLELARALSDHGARSVVLTGVSVGSDQVGAACYDRQTGRAELAMAPRVAGEYHGTGDIFASVLTGALVQGKTLAQAAKAAADFVSACAARTLGQDYPRREGVDFEPLLGRLAGEKGL
jgi:pyridoxine kinase